MDRHCAPTFTLCEAKSLTSTFVSLPPLPFVNLVADDRPVKNPDPNAPTRPGFIKFRDVETATEALTGFNTPELNLSYARPRNRYRASQNSRPLFKKTG